MSFHRTASNEPYPIANKQSHCSSIHMTCSVANFNRFILFFLEMQGFVEFTQQFKFISLSLRKIACLDILMPGLALALLDIGVAVANRSFFVSLPSYLSSLRKTLSDFPIVFEILLIEILSSLRNLNISFISSNDVRFFSPCLQCKNRWRAAVI